MRQERLPAAAWRSRVVVLCALCGTAAGASAQSSISWLNAAGGPWEHGPNWSSGEAPGPSDDARFALGGASYTITFGASAQARGVVVDGDHVTLDLSSRDLRFAPPGWSIDVGSGVSSSRLSLMSGKLAANPGALPGSMDVGSMGRLDVLTGARIEGADVSSTVDGHLAVSGGGQVQLFGFSEVLVNGLATVDGPGSFLSPAEMRVSGELRATSGGSAGAGNGRLTLHPGAIVTADGGEVRGLDIEATGAQINLLNGGRLIAEFGPLNLNAGTTLTGSGEIFSGDAIVNAGIVAPGAAGGGIGDLSFSSLQMADSGRLVFELAGLDAGVGYDTIHTGFAALDGTLEVSFSPGFMPAPGDTFDLIFGARTGEFSSLLLPTLDGGKSLTVVYGDDFVRLAVIPAPTPAAGALLCLGLMGMRRRR